MRLWSASMRFLTRRLGRRKGEELEVLVGLVEAWEGERYPIPPPDPVDAIEFRIDQERRRFGG